MLFRRPVSYVHLYCLVNWCHTTWTVRHHNNVPNIKCFYSVRFVWNNFLKIAAEDVILTYFNLLSKSGKMCSWKTQVSTKFWGFRETRVVNGDGQGMDWRWRCDDQRLIPVSHGHNVFQSSRFQVPRPWHSSWWLLLLWFLVNIPPESVWRRVMRSLPR